MSGNPEPFELLKRSVIVTGTHFSATTLVGALLATARDYRLLHEPLNPQPTLSYDSLKPPRWYEFYDEDRLRDLSTTLAAFADRRSIAPEILERLGKVRSPEHFGQVMRYAQRKLPFIAQRKPLVLKDPFLAFSARTLQQAFGTRIVLCLRHPGAFAESFLRKAGAFDFGDLASQSRLMALIPHEQKMIERFAREPMPAEAQAALLWRVVYGFAQQHYLRTPRTLLVRQEEFVDASSAAASRLLDFVGARATRATQRFLTRNFAASAADMEHGNYIRRDPASAANKWRARLSAEQVSTVRSLTEPLAAELGYGTKSWAH